MSETEIMKALECCQVDSKRDWDCDNCPYNDNCSPMHKDVLGLINRKNAEIEMLKEDLMDSNIEIAELYKCKFSAEDVAQNIIRARKEFAEEMEYEIIHKEFWNEHPNTSQTWLNGYEQCLRDMRVLLKDQIAKEMGVEL